VSTECAAASLVQRRGGNCIKPSCGIPGQAQFRLEALDCAAETEMIDAEEMRTNRHELCALAQSGDPEAAQMTLKRFVVEPTADSKKKTVEGILHNARLSGSEMYGGANGSRTRLSALKEPCANRCTMAPRPRSLYQNPSLPIKHASVRKFPRADRWRLDLTAGTPAEPAPHQAPHEVGFLRSQEP
jgi:hypothetical protein